MDDQERLDRMESALRRYMSKANTKHTVACATELVTEEGLEMGPCNCGLGELEWLLFGFSYSYAPESDSAKEQG